MGILDIVDAGRRTDYYLKQYLKDIHVKASTYLLAFSKSCMHWTRASTASMGQAL